MDALNNLHPNRSFSASALIAPRTKVREPGMSSQQLGAIPLSNEGGRQLRVIHERAQQELAFNVMPDRPVREELDVHEYRVGYRYAEAHFSRRYHSAMKKSPSHLIFLSAQVQMQKLAYLTLCEEFGFEYVPGADELLKIWPTRVDVSLPRMVRDVDGLIQNLSVITLEQVADGIYRCAFDSWVSGSIRLQSEAKVYLI